GPLLGVFFIVFSITAYILFTGAWKAELTANRELITEKNGQIQEMKTQLETLKTTESELELTTEVQRQETLKAIPTQLDQDEVIRSVKEIADDYDIELSSISFAKGPSGKEGIGSLRISASFEGNYVDLIDFLEGLEDNSRIFKVDTINVQISTLEISEIERASFSLTIETFYQI
ncbi:type 4a pilus biogenesis protein PilO, partial [Candidatus Peregrinibacteria bacterium]|nr:type 4a pilus biogenesis protein PilO [Candidatus Peregrinibacteria bacterium]